MNFSGVKKTVSKSIQTISSNKILNSPILYKVSVVLALLNVISYIVSKNINAIIAFTLIYLATNYFTNNMTIVILTAVFVTNFLIITNKIKESFTGEKNNENQDISESQTSETPDDTSVTSSTSDTKNQAKSSDMDALLQTIQQQNKNLTNITGKKNSEKDGKQGYDNIAVKLQPTDIAPVEFNADSAELAKQLKILNERTENSMGMINKLGGISNIGKMIDSLTGIVDKLK